MNRGNHSIQLANISNGSRKYLSLIPLWNYMRTNDIDYCNIKGEVLSLQAYKQYGMRTYGDIDILISKEDFPLLKDGLKQLGFVVADDNIAREKKVFIHAFSHQSENYFLANGEHRTFVDVNFDILWGEYEGRRIDIKQFISDSKEINIYGTTVRCLPPEKNLIQVALHSYKDLNSIYLLAIRKKYNIRHFEEFYKLLVNNIEYIHPEKLYELSYAYGVVPYMYYMFYHIGLLYRNEHLKKYSDLFRTPEGEEIINTYGLCKSERKEWKIDFLSRLELSDIYNIMKDDLTQKDIEKIYINKYYFLGGCK